MPQPTVSISTPAGNTAVPCAASGTAAPSEAGQTLAAMGYQIGTGSIKAFTSFLPGGDGWSLQLTLADCPTVGASYLLTVYAGESPAGRMGTASSLIVRIS